MYHYTAYGLGIQSELFLPELKPGLVKVDVMIRLGKVKRTPLRVDSTPHCSWVDDEKVVLHWNQVATFSIQNGQEVIVDPDPAAKAERVRLFLLGAALGILLQQRGLMVLHASAIALSNAAIAFLGGKGWGKSTMAATLHALGRNLLTDDVLAVDLSQERATILPGFPQLKLWPDALTSIGQAVDPLPRLHPALEKRDYRLPDGFSTNPLALKCIYLLSHGAEAMIEAVPTNQALFELLPHWYCMRFSTQVLEKLGQAEQFLQCANLVRQVPVFRLRRPRSLATLPELAELVQEHCTLALP